MGLETLSGLVPYDFLEGFLQSAESASDTSPFRGVFQLSQSVLSWLDTNCLADAFFTRVDGATLSESLNDLTHLRLRSKRLMTRKCVEALPMFFLSLMKEVELSSVLPASLVTSP